MSRLHRTLSSSCRSTASRYSPTRGCILIIRVSTVLVVSSITSCDPPGANADHESGQHWATPTARTASHERGEDLARRGAADRQGREPLRLVQPLARQLLAAAGRALIPRIKVHVGLLG